MQQLIFQKQIDLMTDYIQQKRGITNHQIGQQKASRLKQSKKYGTYKKQHEKHERHIVLVGEQLKSQKESRQRIMVEAIYKDTVIKKFSK